MKIIILACSLVFVSWLNVKNRIECFKHVDPHNFLKKGILSNLEKEEEDEPALF